MKKIRIHFLCLLFVFTGSCLAQNKKVQILPCDESNNDSSFCIFKLGLVEAIGKKDKQFIYDIVDEGTKLSFGGDEGKEGLITYWDFENPETLFWYELKKCIELGGTFQNYDELTFVAPYVFTNWNEEYDAFIYGVTTKEETFLFYQPFESSQVIDAISFEIVKIIESDEKAFRQIETLNGVKGYVKRENIRSPIDYRCGFIKKKGEWKISFFVAGD